MLLMGLKKKQLGFANLEQKYASNSPYFFHASRF